MIMDDVLDYKDVEDVVDHKDVEDDGVELMQSCFEVRVAHTLTLMIIMLMVMLMVM